VSLAVVLTAAQPSPPGRGDAIRLRAAVFTPARGEVPAVAANLSSPPAQAGRVAEYLVQLRGPVLDAWKDALASAGADLREYVPDFAFRARMTPEAASDVGRLPFVSWLGPYHPAYKLAPNLVRNGRRLYVARLEPGADAGAVAAHLRAAGVEASARGRSALVIAAAGAELDAIARVDDVASVETFTPWIKHNEYGGGVIVGSTLAHASGFDGSTQTVAIADTGLGHGTAAGAHAGLAASRVSALFNWPGAPSECFDTVVNDGAVDVDTGHGTHVATTALGAGNGAGVGRGAAPAANLVFQAIENYAVPSWICELFYGLTPGYYLVGVPGDIGDLFDQGYAAGARVHANSWGSDVAGAYTTDSQNADAFVWSHRDMTVTFSAGNAGVDRNGDGVVDGTSVGSPATAKNVIAVGASEGDRQSHYDCDTALSYTTCAAQGGQNIIPTYGAAWPERYPANPLKDDPQAGNAEQVAPFSSRGPTADGRIKPDVVAPGTWTLSGYSDRFQQGYDPSANPQTGDYQYDGWGFPFDRDYKYMGGTSMAAPLVAGAAAVVRDFYVKTLNHQASAALVKATLINSAVDLLDENNDGLLDNANPIPNMHEGWGRIDLGRATSSGRQFDDETTPLATGASATFTVDVSSPGSPFKATLVWTDYPSTASAGVNLVNDLDLIVAAPDGTTYVGNRFSGGWSEPGGTADRRNNVENVYVFSAVAGTWTVTVSGYNVPMGPQPFALLVDRSPSVQGPPVVRASGVDGTATEAGPTGGAVRFTRGGDVSSPLTVYYTVGGTATAGSDYVALPGRVTIPEGVADVTIAVDALDDPSIESDETVVVTLASDASYTLGSPSSASVTIVSDDLPPDLAVTTMAAPSTAAAGGVMSVTDTTKNQGTAPSPASATGYYLSPDTTLDAADVFLGSRSVSALAAGASELASSSVTIPDTTATGTYYVIAKADWQGEIPETNDNNNARASGAMKVGPDLLVSTVSAPPSAAAGEPVVVTDTAKNQGGGAAAASVTGFYLSTNTSWDAGDAWLGSRSVAGLGPGATDTASTSLLIPDATAVGTYYILAKIDWQNAVAETSETNNVKASAAVKVGADLTVSALSSPTIGAAGEPLTVTDTTKNLGGAEAPASATAFYLSANGSVDASDTRLGARPVPPLGAGGSDTATVSLVVPASTLVGSYYVLAKADDAGAVAEVLETNNVKSGGLVRIGPDLQVSALTGPSSTVRGATITVNDTTRNQGGQAATASTTSFYLSTNSTWDASDIWLGDRAVAALAAGTSSSGSTALTIPSNAATGQYYLVAKADAPGTVTETFETNNTRSIPLKINP
jgi:subtilase family serine protease/subtilisin family serine protease